MPRLRQLTTVAALALGCAAPPAPESPTSSAPPADAPDPSAAEVPLDCAPGWDARLVFDGGETGVWTVRALDLYPQLAAPEIVGLDDRGRCLIAVGYSGKWTTRPTIAEQSWLGALAHGDVDPRQAGPELYVGGRAGNLYQVRAYAHGAVDSRLIARFEGQELHTLVAGDHDPRTPGPELLAFTWPGGLHRVTPSGPDGGFEQTLLEELDGRVRDAVVLPAGADERPWIATVSRRGALRLLRIDADGPRWRTIHQSPTGLGRVALAPARAGRPTVLYTTQDDGVVLRHERLPDGGWATEAIHLGAQGPRGLAAGRFHADAELESVALFGYSAQVELLTCRDGRWSAETVFTDRDRGHWLSTAELDSRNATDELVGSGYGGRIFLLARPPGFGRAPAGDAAAATR